MIFIGCKNARFSQDFDYFQTGYLQMADSDLLI